MKDKKGPISNKFHPKAKGRLLMREIKRKERRGKTGAIANPVRLRIEAKGEAA